MEIYRWLIDHADILGLSIDFIALMVTIFLTVGIYKLERRHEKEDKIFEIRIEIRKVNILTGESNGLCREEILHFCSRNVISET